MDGRGADAAIEAVGNAELVQTAIEVVRPGGRISVIGVILADRVETVTPWLARRVLSNQRSGALIAWLTTGKILVRFLTAPFSKRNLFPPDGTSDPS